jgi:sugar lactone lactonase YvrE
MTRPIGTLVTSLILLAACAPKEQKPAASTTAAAAPPPAPAPPASRISATAGFSTPESVLWDVEQGVWFVTNINGNPSMKDNNGFISRLKADGTIDSLHFVAGGRGGVKLNGPKGMALAGDTLWTADIDAVRGFNRRTGASIASVEVGSKAKFLNDVAAGPDGTIYVTDTGILFDAKGQATHPGPDRIFSLSGRTIAIAAEGAWLEWPNGITWDASHQHFILVPFGGKDLLAWSPGGAKVDTIGEGPGSQDGVEILPDGRVLITSWADSTVFSLSNGGITRLIGGVPSPADIGLDRADGVVAIPVFTENRVEFWKLAK